VILLVNALSVRVVSARIVSFLQFHARRLRDLPPPGEMRTQQLPADFRDWIVAPTFEIGAETVAQSDSSLLARAANGTWSFWRSNGRSTGHCVSMPTPRCSQASSPLLTILAPALQVLPFDFRLVITLAPNNQSRSVLTKITLITVRDEPAVRIQTFRYGFVGPIEMRELLPSVMINARRKAVGYLNEYIASSHPELAANFSLMAFSDGLADFSDWLTSALIGCSPECWQLFSDLKDKTQSQGLADFMQSALRASRESTIFEWNPPS
jgi:hypothetical protein